MPEYIGGVLQETPGSGKAKIVIVHMSIPNLINVMLAGVATIYGNSELLFLVVRGFANRSFYKSF